VKTNKNTYDLEARYVPTVSTCARDYAYQLLENCDKLGQAAHVILLEVSIEAMGEEGKQANSNSVKLVFIIKNDGGQFVPCRALHNLRYHLSLVRCHLNCQIHYTASLLPIQYLHNIRAPIARPRNPVPLVLGAAIRTPAVLDQRPRHPATTTVNSTVKILPAQAYQD